MAARSERLSPRRAAPAARVRGLPVAAAGASAPVGDDGHRNDRHRNDVSLVGRLAATAVQRELPSGDSLVSFRLVVARPPARRSPAAGRTGTVDTVDCVSFSAAVRRTVAGWDAGDTVELAGALRRRFWRASNGPASRYEVEVIRARRVARADR